jgi:beta-phosphoglucomutase-like phosphatase (HAD superfamily)
MTYQGIIFDFNGVLWWDSQLQEQAWREFAREQFGVSLTDEMMKIEIYGRNNRHTLEFLAGTPLDDQQVQQLSGQKEALYRTLCLAQGDGFKLSPGADDLLDGINTMGRLHLGKKISCSSSSTCSLSAGLSLNSLLTMMVSGLESQPQISILKLLT